MPQMTPSRLTSPSSGSPPEQGRRSRPKIRNLDCLSPEDIAHNILKRGNPVTSPIVAKRVLDQHVDGHALAELRNSPDLFAALSIMDGDRDLADDLLKATTNITQKLPHIEVSRPAPPRAEDIAREILERHLLSPKSDEHTPPLSPRTPLSPPEWDFDEDLDAEAMEDYAPRDEAIHETDSTPPQTPSTQDNLPILGDDEAIPTGPSLLRPVAGYSPEQMSMLSALDPGLGGQPGTFISFTYPATNRGGSGRQDLSVPSQSDLVSRHGAPRAVEQESQASQSGEAQWRRPRSSSWSPYSKESKPRTPVPFRVYAEAETQTDVDLATADADIDPEPLLDLTGDDVEIDASQAQGTSATSQGDAQHQHIAQDVPDALSNNEQVEQGTDTLSQPTQSTGDDPMQGPSSNETATDDSQFVPPIVSTPEVTVTDLSSTQTAAETAAEAPPQHTEEPCQDLPSEPDKTTDTSVVDPASGNQDVNAGVEQASEIKTSPQFHVHDTPSFIQLDLAERGSAPPLATTSDPAVAEPTTIPTASAIRRTGAANKAKTKAKEEPPKPPEAAQKTTTSLPAAGSTENVAAPQPEVPANTTSEAPSGSQDHPTSTSSKVPQAAVRQPPGSPSVSRSSSSTRTPAQSARQPDNSARQNEYKPWSQREEPLKDSLPPTPSALEANAPSPTPTSTSKLSNLWGWTKLLGPSKDERTASPTPAQQRAPEAVGNQHRQASTSQWPRSNNSPQRRETLSPDHRLLQPQGPNVAPKTADQPPPLPQPPQNGTGSLRRKNSQGIANTNVTVNFDLDRASLGGLPETSLKSAIERKQDGVVNPNETLKKATSAETQNAAASQPEDATTKGKRSQADSTTDNVAETDTASSNQPPDATQTGRSPRSRTASDTRSWIPAGQHSSPRTVRDSPSFIAADISRSRSNSTLQRTSAQDVTDSTQQGDAASGTTDASGGQETVQQGQGDDTTKVGNDPSSSSAVPVDPPHTRPDNHQQPLATVDPSHEAAPQPPHEDAHKSQQEDNVADPASAAKATSSAEEPAQESKPLPDSNASSSRTCAQTEPVADGQEKPEGPQSGGDVEDTGASQDADGFVTVSPNAEAEVDDLLDMEDDVWAEARASAEPETGATANDESKNIEDSTPPTAEQEASGGATGSKSSQKKNKQKEKDEDEASGNQQNEEKDATDKQKARPPMKIVTELSTSAGQATGSESSAIDSPQSVNLNNPNLTSKERKALRQKQKEKEKKAKKREQEELKRSLMGP